MSLFDDRGKLNTAMAVRETVGRLIADVYASCTQDRRRPCAPHEPEAAIENLLAKSEGGPEAKAAPEGALQDSGEARPPRSDP